MEEILSTLKEITEDILNLMSTAMLVDALKKREGVETTTIKPHEEYCVSVNDPAIVLVIKRYNRGDTFESVVDFEGFLRRIENDKTRK